MFIMDSRGLVLALLLAVIFLSGCVFGGLRPGGHLGVGDSQKGVASFYSDSHRGHKTANGETYDPQAMTAAHRSLPFGTRVRVKNLNNGREVEVRINDRGPYVHGRIIDLSRRAAEKLGMVDSGAVPVRITRE